MHCLSFLNNVLYDLPLNAYLILYITRFDHIALYILLEFGGLTEAVLSTRFNANHLFLAPLSRGIKEAINTHFMILASLIELNRASYSIS